MILLQELCKHGRASRLFLSADEGFLILSGLTRKPSCPARPCRGKVSRENAADSFTSVHGCWQDSGGPTRRETPPTPFCILVFLVSAAGSNLVQSPQSPGSRRLGPMPGDSVFTGWGQRGLGTGAFRHPSPAPDELSEHPGLRTSAVGRRSVLWVQKACFVRDGRSVSFAGRIQCLWVPLAEPHC